MDFIASFDGSVQSTSTPMSEGGVTEEYPARFQIPSDNLDGMDQEEMVRGAEMMQQTCQMCSSLSPAKAQSSRKN